MRSCFLSFGKLTQSFRLGHDAVKLCAREACDVEHTKVRSKVGGGGDHPPWSWACSVRQWHLNERSRGDSCIKQFAGAHSTYHTQDRAAPAGPAAARCGNCSIESRARARLICETIDSRIMDAFLKGLAAGMSKAAIIHPAVVFSLVLRFYNASGIDSSSWAFDYNAD